LNLFQNKELIAFSNSLSGAGGGFPAAFQIFYKSKILYSSEFIEYHLGLHKYADVETVDYLITGEGAYDHQSSFGKGVGVVMNLFQSKVKKIFLVCGKISDERFAKLLQNVYPIELSKYFSNKNEAIKNYKIGLNKACQDIIERLNF
jgi:glycerate kinase